MGSTYICINVYTCIHIYILGSAISALKVAPSWSHVATAVTDAFRVDQWTWRTRKMHRRNRVSSCGTRSSGAPSRITDGTYSTIRDFDGNYLGKER